MVLKITGLTAELMLYYLLCNSVWTDVLRAGQLSLIIELRNLIKTKEKLYFILVSPINIHRIYTETDHDLPKYPENFQVAKYSVFEKVNLQDI